MQIIERGNGPALVLIPGIQGRWEYQRATIDELARFFRVITFPLAGERGARPSPGAPTGLDQDVSHVLTAMDDRGIDRAVVVGVSFGGLVALRFAAARPRRLDALVLTSTPGPAFRLRPRHEFYARTPLVFGPLFLLEVMRRLSREIAITFPRIRERAAYVWRQLPNAMTAPPSLSRMAKRVRLIQTLDPAGDARRITAPTLIVTGEPGLDYIVPVDGSSEYLTLIAGARHVTLPRTGHLGSVTRPAEFAAVVRNFAGRLTSHAASEGATAAPAGANKVVV